MDHHAKVGRSFSAKKIVQPVQIATFDMESL